MFAKEWSTENWCSRYLGKNVMKPDMMVISKQNANVTIMKTRFERIRLIALGRSLGSNECNQDASMFTSKCPLILWIFPNELSSIDLVSGSIEI